MHLFFCCSSPGKQTVIEELCIECIRQIYSLCSQADGSLHLLFHINYPINITQNEHNVIKSEINEHWLHAIQKKYIRHTHLTSY